MNMLTDSHDAVTADWAAALLDFWFNQVGESGWWSHDPALDQRCLGDYQALWLEKQALPAESFLDRADDALAAVLAFIPLTTSVFWGSLAFTLIGGTLGGAHLVNQISYDLHLRGGPALPRL